MRARMERKCEEALTTVSRLDLEIVALQEREQHEKEQARRKVRDDTAAFIKKSCASTALIGK
jgi:FtsZ-binding cell division protein ZapB